jgi:hypothetical protein
VGSEIVHAGAAITAGECHSRKMFWPGPVSWTPRDEAELIAGWRLWLELVDRAWPSARWDGTTAGVVRPLRELLAACDEIETTYRQAVAEPSAEFIGIIQSLVCTAGPVIELWSEDPWCVSEQPLDAERAAMLHSDLAGFGEHAEAVLEVLALNGGWSALASDRRRPAR